MHRVLNLKIGFVVFLILINVRINGQGHLQNFESLTFHLKPAKDSMPTVSLLIQADKTVVFWCSDNTLSLKKSPNGGLFKGLMKPVVYNKIQSLLHNLELDSITNEIVSFPLVIIRVTTDGINKRIQSPLMSKSNGSVTKLSSYLLRYIQKSKLTKSNEYFDFEL
jgi:hypothetical protein